MKGWLWVVPLAVTIAAIEASAPAAVAVPSVSLTPISSPLDPPPASPSPDPDRPSVQAMQRVTAVISPLVGPPVAPSVSQRPTATIAPRERSQIGEAIPPPIAPIANQPPALPVKQPQFAADLDLAARSHSAAALGPLPSLASSPEAAPSFSFTNAEIASTPDPTPAAQPEWVNQPVAKPVAEPLVESVRKDEPNRGAIAQVETAPTTVDPELGTLRMREVPGRGTGDNPALPVDPATVPPAGCIPDPELGCLRLKDVPVVPPRAPRAPIVYLLGRFDYFRTSNVYSSSFLVLTDGLSRPGISLYVVPPLGPDTFFVGSIDGNLVRYSDIAGIDYDELRFRAGITHRLSPTMFTEVGWGNQQLFVRTSDQVARPQGSRFLNDHGIRVELSRRDRLANKLSLNSFYQLRIGFAEPVELSRLSNTLFLSLNYDFQPNLQLGLDYQVVLVRFTQTQRRDSFHQIIARLSYTLVRNVQLSVFGGYSFGNSSDPLVNFDGSVFGASISFSLGLF